jgi:hypothetical protein
MLQPFGRKAPSFCEIVFDPSPFEGGFGRRLGMTGFGLKSLQATLLTIFLIGL